MLAFRLQHFLAFWLGLLEEMAASAAAVRPAWSAAVPAFPAMLGCFAFAAEECGDHTPAERDGRAAVAADPSDLWAAHALAEVFEMTGREEEGIAWTEALAPHWEGANQLAHHLWWHRALYHLDRGESSAVLALYDSRIRDNASPLVQSHPDLYVDVQNAASLLWRLRRLGVAAGERWEELVDKAEAQAEDILSAFTLPHWMMALCGAGRWQAAERWLSATRAAAAEDGQNAALVREVALPVCEAILAEARGDHARALSLIRPVAGRMVELGGSHAQQDVLSQVFLDAPMPAGDRNAGREALGWSLGRFTKPPARRAAWASAEAWAAF